MSAMAETTRHHLTEKYNYDGKGILCKYMVASAGCKPDSAYHNNKNKNIHAQYIKCHLDTSKAQHTRCGCKFIATKISFDT